MKRPLLVAALLASCALPALRADERALNLPIGDPARKDREAAVVLDGITDAAKGDTLTPPELAARLDGVRLLFVGESHTDIEFHDVQLRVIQELHKRGRQVLVGLEMYPVPEQAWLDRWHSDKALTEEAFLAESHWYKNWGYHWNYYRDIFLFARANGIRMFGVNLPRTAVQTIRMKGFDALPPDQRALLPEKVDLDSAEHQRLFKAFFGSEDALHGNMPEPMFQAMYRAQCGWDAAMAWNAVAGPQEARRREGDHGRAHRLGPRGVRPRAPSARRSCGSTGRPPRSSPSRSRRSRGRRPSPRCRPPTPTSSGACRPRPTPSTRASASRRRRRRAASATR